MGKEKDDVGEGRKSESVEVSTVKVGTFMTPVITIISLD